MKKAIPYVLIFLLAACATGPERKEPPADFQKDAVMFQFGYSTAFDRLTEALEAEGYDIAVADERAGFIQTDPKTIDIKPEDARLQYRGLYRIQVDGDRDRSWAVIQFLIFPELPGEREKLINRIQGETPKTP
ncbi:MAG: hypothetical protein EPO39_06135 [Candidatus Manganitrophaceae bacterium]|nr:MAG: hypothetical protein EPO39_06135 [Candidatus Manganitrophaceae bacterium]